MINYVASKLLRYSFSFNRFKSMNMWSKSVSENYDNVYGISVYVTHVLETLL